MKWLVLPLLVVFGLVELALRVAAACVLSVVSVFFGVWILESQQPGITRWFLTPVSFTLAERIVK